MKLSLFAFEKDPAPRLGGSASQDGSAVPSECVEGESGIIGGVL